MNKIYKVIWSKVRNCYVAVSEIAKRNSKSCTSVNCGAKANRGHAGVALAIALSLSLAGGGVAWAEVNVTGNTTINTDNSTTLYRITAENITFTVGSAGSIQAIYNDPARNGNTVIVKSGGKVTGDCGSVVSGYFSDCGIALNGSDNNVTINGRVENSVYGGYSGADALRNTVTLNTGGYVGGDITASSTSATFDRESAQGTVNINGGTVAGQVIGSSVWGSGTATGTINIKGGTVGSVNKNMWGSYVSGYGSSATGKAVGTINIDNGTVKCVVVGAFTNAQSGTAIGTVTINGGTVEYSVYGSNSYYTDVNGSSVSINGGTVNSDVSGGHSYHGSATGNTVLLGGVEIGGDVRGGFSSKSGSTNDFVTGNKLILTKSGNSSNRSVYNFETIEFSNTLGWTANGTVLSANSFPDNADGTRAALNISNSKLSSATTRGTMTLLKSNQANDFNTLSLKYSGGTATLNSSNQKKDVKTGTETTESSPVNGVTLKYKDVHTVSLDAANSYKNVLYTIGQKSTGITLGTVTYAKNGTARSFDNTYDLSGATINANNLKFTDASQKNMEPGDTMTIVDASSAIKNASGLALPSFTSKTYNTAYTDTISGKGITFTGTHTDTLSQSTDTAKSKLIYTIGDKKVSSAALTGAVTWSNGSTYYTNSKYKFNTNATTNLSGLSFGTVSSDPYGQSMTLISGNVAGTVSNAPASFAVSVNKTNTTLGATAAGSASIASSKLTYKVNGVALNKVTVKSVGNTADAVPANWTLKSGATVETGSMTVPTGLSAGAKKVIISASGTNYFNGITINGSNAWGAGTALTTNLSSGGVTIAGKQTKAGVKVNEANKNQIVYEASKKNITGITLDTVTYAKNGTARSFDNTYDLSGATINANNLKFTDASQKNMEPGDTMTIVDASSAIKNASGLALPSFTSKTYNTAYTDTISGKGITFTGTHTDTLSQSTDTAKSKLIYTIGDKKVNNATISGTINWSDGGTHYTNGSEANQNGTNVNYKFEGSSAVDISGVAFNATVDPLAGSTKSMTLLKGVTGVVATKVSGTPAFTVALDKTNTKLDAKASGLAGVSGNDVIYTVNGVAIDKINVKSVGDTADVVPENWTLASGATVETDGMTVTVPSGLNHGQKKTIITAGVTDYFDGIMINGSNAWSAGTELTGNLTVGGVTITGTQTKGGVKVNEANKSQIVYEESKKNATSITLGEVKYVKGGTARSFDSAYDVSNATITADGLTFTSDSKTLMETGDSMNIVDAASAIANSITGHNLSAFTGKEYTLDYTDTITVKGVTFKGTHTDTLSQSTDTAKSKLIYTIGDKKVNSATVTGTINWSDGGAYYTNGSDANQNGTSATYTFNENTAVDISGVAFSATTDPLGKSMTLLKGVTGVAESKISGTPSFAVALDKSNTKLDAKASGSAGVSGNDVTYAVSDVAIDKINVKSIANDADTVPDGWTLAKDDSDKVIATVETDGLSISDPSGLEPGETKVIIEAAAGSADYFKDVAVNGSYAWKADGSDITSDLDIGGVAITGTQTKGGVKVNEADTNQIIYEESKKLINTLTLGNIEFKIDDGTAASVARTFDKTYDVSTATISAGNLAFANSDIMETGNTMRIVDASVAIPNAVSGKKLASFTEQSYDVDFTDTITEKGVIFTGKHTDTLSQDAEQTTLTYTVGEKVVSNATLSGTINWSDDGTHYTNGGDANQNGTSATYTFNDISAVDISSVAFSATTDPLGKSMTLLKGVTGVVEKKINGIPSFTIALDKSNTKLDANASGAAGVSGNDVTYTVSGVAIDKINVTSITNDADTVPTGWTLAKDDSDKVIASVETDGLSVSDPSGLKPGETKVIIEAADGSTDYFKDVSVNGSYAWKADGSDITSDLDIGGVAITGTQTKGGVKVNEADTNQIIYEESKKLINTLTLGNIEFKIDDGTAASVARTFDKTYDVSTASISADDLAFTNSDIMETGNTMRIVDASAAIPNVSSGKKMLSFTEQTKDVEFTDTITGKGITFKGTHTDTLSQDAGQTTLTYTVGDKVVSNASVSGDIGWQDGGTHYTNGSDENQNGTKATYTFNENSTVDISGVAFKADSDPLAGATKSMTMLKGVTGVVEDKISGSPSFAVTIDQANTKLEATAAGAASVDEAGSLKYTVTAVELNTVTVNGTGNDALPEGWTVPEDVVINTENMTVPTDLAAGESKTILTAGGANLFSDEDITGANAYSTSDFTDTDAANIVTLTGTQGRGVTTADEGKILVYKVGFKEVDNIDIGTVTWEKGATVMDGSTGYDYGNVTAIGTDNFDVTYDTPEIVAAGESMTLLKANETLKDMAAGSKSASYSFEPVAGVTVDAALTGNLAAKDGAVTYTVDANRASKLTFGGVEWKDTGALLARPANIVFAGADVDTSNISFTNVSYLDANRKMTLVSDFGDSVGNITGKKYEVGKYTIGTAFEGEGTASLSGSDLIFTTTTDAGLTGQTHKTVMAMDAGLAMLLTGNEFVGKTMDGLAEVKNKGKDGISTFASVGGGASRYTTGSHVSTHTWNAVVGVGKTNETKKGTMEYGVFGEYGKGSYTLHSDDGNGDGDAYYAGGGLLAKWTNKHDVYTEASIRAGRLSDSSGDIMQDGLGNKYGYDVHANYYGAHAGVGKIINYKGGKSLDVYGKFFYLKRDGVEYDAVQHYNLDSVSSSILRIGGRYGTTDKKWNWYGGLAYEYEFDGEAKGVVNGKAIRAASVKGSSVRGEFGMRMDATKTNPWQTDISLYGYAGKHRGFGGSVSVVYTF